MALEPTSIQRDRMLAQGKTRLTLVQFLVVKDPAIIGSYLAATKKAARAEGGSRDHQLQIDLVLTRDDFPYQYLIVDSFPSSQALLQAHENTREDRLAAIAEIYALTVRSNPAIKRVVKGLGFLSSVLAKSLGTSQIKEIQDLADRLDPDTDPDPGKVNIFRAGNLDQPFYMMNLNQFTPKNKLRASGKGAYNQYSARILPYLVSVGGYPDIYGKILGLYIGDQNDPLYIKWHDFALVYYPSRGSFLRLMTNTPRGAAEIRRAGLKKVVLMPSSQIQD